MNHWWGSDQSWNVLLRQTLSFYQAWTLKPTININLNIYLQNLQLLIHRNIVNDYSYIQFLLRCEQVFSIEISKLIVLCNGGVIFSIHFRHHLDSVHKPHRRSIPIIFIVSSYFLRNLYILIISLTHYWLFVI